MIAPALMLLKSRWFLMIMVSCYLLLIWGVFVVVNHEEIVQASLLRSPTNVPSKDVMELYGGFQRQAAWTRDDVMLMRLAEALIHQGHIPEARQVSLALLARNPEDRALRFQVALALHNAGLYEEAEPHFSILLEEQGNP